MRKVCVVITARPSYARVKTLLQAIKDHSELQLQLVVGASALLERYGPVIDVIRADGFEPDEVVHMVLEGENLVTTAKSTGLGVVELATIFDNLKPDLVVSIADRYETIATAIASSYLNIPLAHIQGGEVTGSIDEKVRHAVTKLANLHFVSNQSASDRVIRMGEEPHTVFITGCPSIDIAAGVVSNQDDPLDSERLFAGVGEPFDISGEYLVVMQHPVTTSADQSLDQVHETLDAITRIDMPTFWFWPNVDAGSDLISKGIRVYREANGSHNIYFLKNLPPGQFLRLLLGSRCLIGNSSVGIRESAYLGIPVVNIGDRQTGRDRGPNVVDVEYSADAIVGAINHQMRHGPFESVDLYGNGHAGVEIARLLAMAPLTIEKRITY